MENIAPSLNEKKAVPFGSTAGLIGRVKRATQRKYLAEEKIKIVLEGFRREISVSDLCRREKLSPAIYYSWLKQFMEAGKSRLRGDTLRNATNDEVEKLKSESVQLKELIGDQALELSLIKKRLLV